MMIEELLLINAELHGSEIRYLKNQTREICLKAVKQSPFAYDYVKEKTAEILAAANKASKIFLEERRKMEVSPKDCLETIKESENVLNIIRYVKVQTHEISLAAVKNNGLALLYITYPNREIYMEAIKQNCFVIHFIPNQTREMCLTAVRINGRALYCVDEQTEEICLAAVKQNGLALEFVLKQTVEICIIALVNDPASGKYVKIELAPNMQRYLDLIDGFGYVKEMKTL